MKITYDTDSDSISCPELTPEQTRQLQSQLSAALTERPRSGGGRRHHGDDQVFSIAIGACRCRLWSRSRKLGVAVRR